MGEKLLLEQIIRDNYVALCLSAQRFVSFYDIAQDIYVENRAKITINGDRKNFPFFDMILNIILPKY